MVISAVAETQIFNGNGSQTSFNYPYPYTANTDFKVYVGGVLQTLTTHYTVNATGAVVEGKFPGANIVFLSAPAAGSQNVRISRRITNVQNTDISSVTQFNTTDIELVLDKNVMAVQDAVDVANRVSVEAVDAAVTASAAAIAPSVAASAASAASASSSASTATTQAGIATTQAGNASGSASAASASATLAGNYANYAEDSLVPSGSGYSALHWRNKAEDQYLLTQQIVDALGQIVNGTWLSRVLRESPNSNDYSFTTVPSGDYLVNCLNLTSGQKVTANLHATPNIATINRFEIKASAGKEFHLNGNGKDIEGHEGTTAYIDVPCLLEVAFDTQKDKYVIILKGLI